MSWSDPTPQEAAESFVKAFTKYRDNDPSVYVCSAAGISTLADWIKHRMQDETIVGSYYVLHTQASKELEEHILGELLGHCRSYLVETLNWRLGFSLT